MYLHVFGCSRAYNSSASHLLQSWVQNQMSDAAIEALHEETRNFVTTLSPCRMNQTSDNGFKTAKIPTLSFFSKS